YFRQGSDAHTCRPFYWRGGPTRDRYDPAASLSVHSIQLGLLWCSNGVPQVHARLLGSFIQANGRGVSGQAGRYAPDSSPWTTLDRLDLRAAALGGNSARTAVRDYLGSQTC